MWLKCILNCQLLNRFTGFWYNENCGSEHQFICKRAGSVPANTTVAPTEIPKGGCLPNWVKFNSKVRG